jgi:hypothetical protein
MADLSDLRTAVRETAERAAPPVFDLLARRAGLRRRRRHATAAVAGLAAVAVAGAIALGPVRPEASGPPLRPAAPGSHTPAPRPASSLAERVLTDAKAGVLDFAVSPTDPDVRALTKGGVLGLSTDDTQWATAVTTDGFGSSRFLDVGAPGATIVPLPGRRFFVGPGRAADKGPAWVVSREGRRTPVSFSHGTRPAAVGEVLVPCGVWQYCALDPDRATAHWFPGPAPTAGRDPGLANGLFELWQDGPVIWGYSGNADEPPSHPTVVWSRDGGAHWSSRAVPGLGPGVRFTALPTQAGGPDLVLAYGTGHGAVYSGGERVQVRTLLRSRDGGAHWETVRFPGGHDIADGAVLADGRALVVTTDGRLFRSADAAWDSWTDLSSRWPEPGGDEQHLSISGAGPGTLFSARIPYGSGQGSVWTSMDAGSTWSPAAQPRAR